MHVPADLDAGRTPALSPAGMKGWDAAQLSDPLCRALAGHVGRGGSLPETVAGMVPNAAPEGKAGRQIDHKQTSDGALSV